MARRYIPIDDLTAEGLREDVASTKKLWKTLENVRRGTGGWQKRPGIDRIDTGSLPSVTIGNPKQIITYKHPDSVSQSEILRPTSVGNYDQWTKQSGDNYTNVDEVTANDDTDYVEEATKGEKTSFGFGDLTLTYNSISSIRVHVRAKQISTVTHTLLVKARISGTDYNFGSGSVTIGKGSSWLDLSIDASINPATNLPWTTTEVDALEIILEKDKGLLDTQVETLSYTGFPKTVGTTRVFDNLPTALSWSGTPTTEIKVTWDDDPLGLKLADDNRVFITLLASSVATHNTFWIPLTGTAEAFRIARTTPGQTAVLSGIDLVRTGDDTDDTQTLRVTQVFATIEGDGDSTIRNSLLMVTADAFLRVAEDLSTYTDVVGTASAPTASAGVTWDHAVFLDKLYITNGKDQMFKYPTGSNVFDSLSGFPVGATMSSYGSRLCLGDVIEDGVRSPSRFRWSAIDNAENWSDSTSGNLELDETIGKIVKLKPLVELSDALVGVLVGYKRTGIYHLAPTGKKSEPFVKKLMDGSTGCLARGSVVGISTPEGQEAHVFLGLVGGTLNVMSWDGRGVNQFGFEIIPILESIGDTIGLEKSIATIDTFGNYVLMFPTSNSSFLKTALVFNFNKRKWTTWTLGNVTALGRWVTNLGRPLTVLGRPDSFAYQFDDTIDTDDTDQVDAATVSSTLETGDFSLMAPEIWRDSTLQRVWLFYEEDTKETVITLDATADGGSSRSINESKTSQQFTLTGGSGVKLKRMETRVPGRRHGVRFQSTLAGGKPQFLQLVLEIEEGGVES